MTISESDFRKLDLNLLRAFQTLVREKSVSRAAERLFLGQPAMSGALARLRDIFHDEILVRTGRGMEPTTKALALYSQLAPAMESIRTTLLEQPVFDPADPIRTFHLGMRDWVEAGDARRCWRASSGSAPWVQIAVRASNAPRGRAHAGERGDGSRRLGVCRRSAMVAPGATCRDGLPVHLRRQSSRHRVAADARAISRASAPCDVNPNRFPRQGRCRTGRSQQTAESHYATARYGAMPLILRRADFIATIPEQSAQQWTEMFGLTSSVVPVRIPPFGHLDDLARQARRRRRHSMVARNCSQRRGKGAGRDAEPAKKQRRRAQR